MHIFMRHHLTNVALEDILGMINVIVGYPSLPTTFYSFSKFFGTHQFVRHFVCKSCGLYYGETPEEMCQICSSTKSDYFVSFDIISSLKNVLLRNWKQIEEYKLSTAEYRNDITQGRVIQSLRKARSIFISFNTDGVAIFNSNVKKSLWPIIITINDLPPALRFLRSNMVVAGLWLANGDPDLDVFMKPFLLQLQNLANVGLELFVGLQYKIYTICCCVDSVARCKLQQIKQFNGYEACSFCKHPGTMTDKNQIRYASMNNIQARNHRDTVNAMDLCTKRGVPVEGIKGISCLLAIPNFDVILYCPVDYMHAILLGVCKQLCNIWFEKFGHESYIKKHIDEIDQILTSISPFRELSRYPRKLTDRKTWKANEWLNWLLLYSSVCLKKHLPNEYYIHHQLLVTNVTALLSRSLTDDIIQHCEFQLNLFVEQFQILYGIDEMKYNVHLLIHLCECVRNYGPLWTFSLFNFEDMNGVLKKYVKGPKQPIIQIATRCVLTQIKENVDLSTINQENVRTFIEELNKPFKNQVKCITASFIVHPNIVNNYDKQFEERDYLISNRYTFKRSNTNLSNVSKRDDSTFTMLFEGNDIYGVIKHILFADSNYYLLYKPIIIDNEFEEPFIGIEIEDLKLVEVNSSLTKCIRIFAFDTMYIRKVDFVPWVD